MFNLILFFMLEFADPRLDQDYHSEFRSYLDKSLMILIENPQNKALRIQLIDIYNDSIAKANDYYKLNDHHNALQYFLNIYEIHNRFSGIIHESDSSTKKENHILNVILNIAECHFHLNNLKESLKFYCTHCSMILLSAELANYKISDYQVLITKIDKILSISQTLKDQKIFDDFSEVKTEFLQKINSLESQESHLPESSNHHINEIESEIAQFDFYSNKIEGHLRFSSLNFSFKNDKLASKHLDNALEIYSQINAQNHCNTTLKNISIGDLFYKYQFFGNALEIYFEGYSRLQKIYDNTGNDKTELKDQIVVYLFRIAECQINLRDIENTKFTIDFISVLDENNDQLKLLTDRLNEIQLSSNLIPHQPQQNDFIAEEQILPSDKIENEDIENEETHQPALDSIRIDPDFESTPPDQSFLDISSIQDISSIPRINSVDRINLVESGDNIHDDPKAYNQSSQFVNGQLGFLDNDLFSTLNNDVLLVSNIDDSSKLLNLSNSSENAVVAATVGILTHSSSNPNEESAHTTFITIGPDQGNTPSPISTAQPKVVGNRSQSLLRAGCTDKCVIS